MNLLNYWLLIESDGQEINIDFGNCEASRGAVIAGLRQAKDIKLRALDEDDKKIWIREI